MQNNLAVISDEKLFREFVNITSFDKDSIMKARKVFDTYKAEGVIRENCNYEDDTWHTTNEYENISFSFMVDEFKYKRFWEADLGLTIGGYVDYCKVYATTLFGKLALRGIQNVLRDLRNIVSNNFERLYDIKAMTIYSPGAVDDFFSALPESDDNTLINYISNAMAERIGFNQTKAGAINQRSLAQFHSYLEFDEIIRKFWEQDMDDETRFFYYPLYLWWIITAVIPLRPREFLVIPRDCLSMKNGSYYLTLRRNMLKGSGRKQSYKLELDYMTNTYMVPTYIGEAIETYIKQTEKYDATDIDTLFVTDPHYIKWNQAKHSNSRFLTYVNMNTILGYFYSEVVEEQFGYSVVYDTEHQLEEREICKIHLGDTRHIAMINIMQEGGTPTAAMYLAGHFNTDMGAHYYTNLKKMIECTTYREYRRLTGSESVFQLTNPRTGSHCGTGFRLTDGSYCYSEKFIANDFSDCMKVAGPNGELGHCPSCTHNRKNVSSYFTDTDIYARNLETDCLCLNDAIDRFRKGKGCVEDIGQAMLRISNSSLSYKQFCLEKMNTE